MTMYKPLPENLYIKKSNIHGFGLFAKEDINKGHEFGITHVYDIRFKDNYIRTPLGGFFNHSENPNCEAYIDREFIKLRSIQLIKKDTEITVKYWLYNIEGD